MFANSCLTLQLWKWAFVKGAEDVNKQLSLCWWSVCVVLVAWSPLWLMWNFHGHFTFLHWQVDLLKVDCSSWETMFSHILRKMFLILSWISHFVSLSKNVDRTRIGWVYGVEKACRRGVSRNVSIFLLHTIPLVIFYIYFIYTVWNRNSFWNFLIKEETVNTLSTEIVKKTFLKKEKMQINGNLVKRWNNTHQTSSSFFSTKSKQLHLYPSASL